MHELQDMFERQLVLARNFIPIDALHTEETFSFDRQKYLAQYVQLLEEEAVEFLRELPARKFWRPSVKEKVVNQELLLEELSDLWHILISITIMSGVDATKMHELYVAKNEKNLERVRNKS